jgi:hypothetical protein
LLSTSKSLPSFFFLASFQIPNTTPKLYVGEGLYLTQELLQLLRSLVGLGNVTLYFTSVGKPQSTYGAFIADFGTP